MEEKVLKRLPKVARYNMFLNDLITTSVILAILYFISIFIYAFDAIPDLIQNNYRYLYYLTLIWMLVDIVLTQLIGYRRIRYSISEKSVEVYRGIYFISHEIVPIRRIQQVDINQGPINRLFKLSNIDVITSGGMVQLSLVRENESEDIASLLRDRINELIEKEQNEQAKNLNRQIAEGYYNE